MLVLDTGLLSRVEKAFADARAAILSGEPLVTTQVPDDLRPNEHPEETVCPWCGQHHDVASGLGHLEKPKRGKFTICLNCGHWCVFISRGRLRKPNARQREVIRGKPELRRVERAWSQATRKRIP